MTGRPKMRWVNGVDQDSETIGERYWRNQANDKDKWKSYRGKSGPSRGCRGDYYYY
jgi:hypothetical protein